VEGAVGQILKPMIGEGIEPLNEALDGIGTLDPKMKSKAVGFMFSILPNCESVCVHGPGWRYCWTFDPSPRSLPPLQRSVGYNRYPTYECDAVGAILEKRGRNNKGIVIGKK